MLPSNLLVARKYRDTIRPIYAELKQKNLDLAERVINAYNRHLGKSRGELEEEVAELEGIGYDYRYVRGLATLLDRRARYEVEAQISPELAREQVFHSAAVRGIPTTIDERQALIESESEHLDVSVRELEGSLYADLEEEQVLVELQPTDPLDLVKQYNLSLTQTLLFKSSMMEFTASGNWQQIFRRIKWCGLIYTISRGEDGYNVKVDGPISLFKLSHRYGTSIAKLLPYIVSAKEWKIHALILRSRGDRRLLNLHLNSDSHGEYLKARTLHEGEYDSVVEESFADRFSALDTGWEITREPGPLPVGRRVMIPDFLLEKAGMRVYMEIAGFWTPEYLRHKIEQLRNVDGIDMIVAANRRHACKELDQMGRKLDIIYYKREVPLQPIYQHLKEREAKLREEQLRTLKNRRFELDSPVIQASDFAQELGVLEEAAQELIENHRFAGYQRLGDTLVSQSKLDKIASALEERIDRGPLKLKEAQELIQRSGVPRPVRVLEHLGYKIEWRGINPNDAEIEKVK
ncbi:MAG: DUF790 family protein [Candidatus Bathyarchaeia archaeon]